MPKPFSLASVLCVALLCFLLTACNFTDRQQKITIAGSTTILPVSEDWANDYYRKARVLVNVQGGGSTNGIVLVKTGKVDIGASSRALSDEEMKGLRKIEIGKDALAVVVNVNNKVDNISTEQLRGIFAGKIKNWKEIGGEDKPIQVVNRESGSGTRTTFEELVMCPHHGDKRHCPEMLLSAIVVNSNAEVKRTVELVPDSIGYFSFGFLDETVKPLSLNGVSALEEEVHAGNYPLARGLYYLVRADNKSKTVADFIAYIMLPEAQVALSHEGFMSVK